MTLRRRAAVCGLVVTLLPASGCQYLGMVRQRRALRSSFASEPRLAVQRVLAPEDSFRVTGRLAGAERFEGGLVVVAIGHRFAADEVVAWRGVPRALDAYGILLPEGEYDLLVLADPDGDGVFESNGLVGRTDPSAAARSPATSCGGC